MDAKRDAHRVADDCYPHQHLLPTERKVVAVEAVKRALERMEAAATGARRAGFGDWSDCFLDAIGMLEEEAGVDRHGDKIPPPTKIPTCGTPRE